MQLTNKQRQKLPKRLRGCCKLNYKKEQHLIYLMHKTKNKRMRNKLDRRLCEHWAINYDNVRTDKRRRW